MILSGNLVSNVGELGLNFHIGSVFVVEKESEVLLLFPQGVGGNDILIMSIVEVIVLHDLFILKVPVLLLDRVQLVSQCQVVFVSLLDFKDLSFQLGDKEVFLIACKVNGIVELNKTQQIKRF